jgi:ATP-dependent RNA helicase DeaD
MRADASQLANELVMSGFAASGLSGEMEQAARTRTLAAFKQGGLRCLIATDVAARGIDVQDVARVIHAELPTNADAYTHRSGRTGRAGRRGTSSLLVAPAGVVHATRLLRGLGIAHRFEPIPTIEEIQRADDERTFAELTSLEVAVDPDPAARYQALAERLVGAGTVERTLARLLAKSRATTAQPREVRNFAERPSRDRPNKRERFDEREDRRQRRQGLPSHEPTPRDQPAPRERARDQTAPRERARDQSAPRERAQGASRERVGSERGFTAFRVSWGQRKGADARRLLAVVCRRGDIRGRDVGAIRVEPNYAIVDVSNDVAEGFARAAAAPDPREPGVTIRRDSGDAGASPLPRADAARFAPRPALKSRPAPRKPFKRGANKA